MRNMATEKNEKRRRTRIKKKIAVATTPDSLRFGGGGN